MRSQHPGSDDARPLSGRAASGKRVSAARLLAAQAVLAVSTPSPLVAVQAGDIERVPLVLGSAVVYRPLPFDEPFYLSGRVDARIDSVGLWIAESDDERVDCLEARPPGARSGEWRRERALDPDSFYVRVDELPPNRRFEICVTARSVPPEDRLERLRAEWRAVVDSAFRGHPGRWSPTDAELDRFRTGLLGRIGPGVEPAPGSLLDRSTTRDGFVAGLPALIVVSEAQAERALVLADIAAASDRAAAALRETRAQPALGALVGLKSATSGAPRTLSSAYRVALETAAAVHAATEAGLNRIARGEAGMTRGVAPAPRGSDTVDMWTIEEVEPHLTLLEETADRVGELVTAVRSLDAAERAATTMSGAPEANRAGTDRSENGPLTSIGIGGADLTRLDRALQRAVEEIAAVANGLSALAELLAARSRALDEAVEGLIAHERATIAVEAHTHYDVETAARNHVAADFGAIYLPDLGTVTPVLGANFYLRPVNRDRGPGGHLLRRLAINVGITTSSLAREGLREDLFGSLNLVIGAGLRLTRLLRVSGGAVLLRAAASESSSDDLRLKATPFLGLTLDFVVKDAVSGLFGEIF